MFPCAEARTAIYGAFEPQGDGRSRVPENQRFYPRDKLKKILTRDRVAEVLKCSCDHCEQQRRDLKLIDPPSKYIDSILDAAISLFALLLFIRASPFVAGFLVERVYDQSICNVPGAFLKVNIGDQYWSNFHKRRKEESEALEDEFRNHLFQFAIPTLTSRHYHAFHEQIMLPFVEQRQLGRIDEDGRLVNEGAYGTVYAFKIWPAYNALPNSEGIKWFARKQLDVPTRLFSLEKENLEMANRLRDPHIVKIIKTYKHGNKYNIIFPLSRTNLRHYLREDRFVNPVTPLEANPLWQQVLGVAKALNRIINFGLDDTPSASDGGYYGFHFDLKPENILVENDGALLISDFGQATFVERGGSSRVDGHGGTEAYAPPEIDNLEKRQTQKYDIWSLGCIFIEVVTTIVLGSESLKEFDELRVTTAGNMTDDRFFEIDPGIIGPTREHRIKSVILSWLEGLPRRVESQKSKEFLEKIIRLIKGMLSIDASDRLSSTEVVWHLHDILQEYQGNRVVSIKAPQARHGEFTVGFPQLGKIEMWYKEPSIPEGQKAKMFCFQRVDDSRLRIVIQTRTHSYTKDALRKDLMLVPKYAFDVRDSGNEWLYFKRIATGSSYSFQEDKFSFTKLTFQDAHTVQSILTSQCVKLSCRIELVKYTRARGLLGKAFRSLSGSLKGHDLDDIGAACTLQLWVETNYADQKANKQSTHIKPGWRPPRELPRAENVPSSRLAIFHYDRIVVIPFAQNWTIKSHETDTKILRLEPRDASRDPSFSVATLNASPDRDSENHCYPGIPLVPALLKEQEENNRCECSEIVIHFKDKDVQGTLIGFL
ncbi:Mitogen-activated protein kinase 12 [Talaromyces pinophilus]|nr:Mitogen-activated protein kinase 12 [Talaromyces pinophilus]